MPHHVFHVPSRLSCAHSLLGRAVRRRMGDARRAEAVFLLTVSALALGLVMAHFLLWTWLEPERAEAALLWGAQGGVAALFAATCVVGFAPSVTVRVDGSELVLRQGKRHAAVPHWAVQGHEMVTAVRYWRDFAPYRSTQPFMGRVPAEVLVLRAAGGPYALGLAKRDLAVILDWLEQSDAHVEVVAQRI